MIKKDKEKIGIFLILSSIFFPTIVSISPNIIVVIISAIIYISGALVWAANISQ